MGQGITPKQNAASVTERRLKRLGLDSPQDYVVHLPIRYEDETRLVPIGAALAGQSVQIEGVVLHSEIQLRPRRQLLATVSDDTGRLSLRWLHFYPNQHKQVAKGRLIRVRGEVRSGFAGLEIVHPKISSAGGALASALTPVYPTTEGLTQPVLRKLIDRALEVADLSDTLPDDIRDRYALIPFSRAIRALHHPPADVSASDLLEREHPAWRRIKFDELLAQQLCLARARAQRLAQRSPVLKPESTDLIEALHKRLPFGLTGAQQRVVDEILRDLQRGFPMHRLLQGDVGSGKTVVAAIAAVHAIAAGVQVAIMAPTEILAEQHLHKMVDWLEPLGIRTVWLTGSLSQKTRREATQAIASGEAQLIVGTQALIQDKVEFARLGLIILDEQHRFGVGQRLELSRKGESADDLMRIIPHQLNMSATPIPRTLAMTFFADLDVSIIDELPPGRQAVLTKLLADTRREELMAHIATEVSKGRQVYWVCPLVEESEALQLQTAVDTHHQLSEALAGMSVGLVHGRMKPAEKAEVMAGFREGKVQVLVATTVIEVGVDVPNASLMVIEHAERFGLAQLHQLRGRVGRGSAQSVCVLLYQNPLSAIARQRLRAMYETTDGFEIARRDLELRGPGEFLGVRQSGVQILRFASLDSDGDLVNQAQALAAELLQSAPHVVDRHLTRWMRGKQDFLRS